MKPSALKNELNAALHFIKFVKRLRNLAVTDPTFNATLENTECIEKWTQSDVCQYRSFANK